MASIAGNKRRHSEHMLSVKYAALMENDKGLSNKELPQKIKCPRNTLSTCKKNREKIIAALKSNAGTKRQRIKEETY